ncbi:MAG: hypothetical protein NZ602_13960 [Thermoguttaceae bacterium]|nr:hypothetical protein [Thermoguttaceae bacterium]MDW8039428.1 hypothetical protein [Thermoguttaceae bacterium]
MSLNFFGWIREGVKQSVLMGVHDALEQLGPRPDEDPIRERLVAFLAPEGQVSMVRSLPAGPQVRKKLGRGLKDIQAESASAEQ